MEFVALWEEKACCVPGSVWNVDLLTIDVLMPTIVFSISVSVCPEEPTSSLCDSRPQILVSRIYFSDQGISGPNHLGRAFSIVIP